MTDTLIPSETHWLLRASRRPFLELARNIVNKLLLKLEIGEILLKEGNRKRTFGKRTSDFSLSATVTVKDPRAYSMITFGGSIGTAEAYMLKYLEVDDLTSLIRIIIRNQIVFRDLDLGFTRLLAPFYNLYHFFRRNTVSGARKNIMVHYDLGNDFYKLFLDETMTYSSGIFERTDASLKEASVAKYDRICKKLNLSERDHLLEIGTGWGGFTLHAVQNYGCRVTTTTISDEQYAFAENQFKEKGIDHRVTLLKKDYRDLEGEYDKLVSIEMIEAVGHQYLNTYMKKCADLLKPNGMMLIQAITIADWAFDQQKKSADFIKRYIFPGSCIPSVTAISQAQAKNTDLRLFHLEDITPHYAITLKKWRENFLRNLEQVKNLGFPEQFTRMWEYYLQYCEAGFLERYIGNVHMLFTKPLTRIPMKEVSY